MTSSTSAAARVGEIVSVKGDTTMDHAQPRRISRRDAIGAAAIAPLGLALAQPAASAPAAVVRRMRAAYERVDVAGVLATLSPDLAFSDPTFQLHANGLAGMKEVLAHGAADIAAIRLVVEHELACGTWIVARQEQVVTFKGRAAPVSVRGVSLFRVEAGLIREWHDYYDAMGMQRQLKAPGVAR